MPKHSDIPEGEVPTLEIEEREWPAGEVIEGLQEFLSDRRRERIARVVERRTNTVVPVIEGLYNMGNVSAVLRSAEALGYQEVHVVESDKRFKDSSRTSQGAEKWLDIRRWDTPGSCCRGLKARNYQVVAAHLEAAVPLEEIDFTAPTAVVFGNEADGISDEMLDRADRRCRIPIEGFVQSYNVSVAAALVMYHAYRERTARLGAHGDLSPVEKQLLTAHYYLHSVKEPELILRRYLRETNDE